jgi:hypothetical protein
MLSQSSNFQNIYETHKDDSSLQETSEKPSTLQSLEDTPITFTGKKHKDLYKVNEGNNIYSLFFVAI